MATLLDCERASANLGAVCQVVHARVLMRSTRNQQRSLDALVHQGVEFGFHMGSYLQQHCPIFMGVLPSVFSIARCLRFGTTQEAIVIWCQHFV